jgi:hypothetical protein
MILHINKKTPTWNRSKNKFSISTKNREQEKLMRKFHFSSINFPRTHFTLSENTYQVIKKFIKNCANLDEIYLLSRIIKMLSRFSHATANLFLCSSVYITTRQIFRLLSRSSIDRILSQTLLLQ